MLANYLSKLKLFLSKWKKVISAAFYMILVFIVVYGISTGVYDGFPIFIPYIVMSIFIVMAFVRIYQWAVPQNEGSEKASDDSSESAAESSETDGHADE